MKQDSWSQLSTSSKRALQWSGALARYRTEQNVGDRNSSRADSYDLLVGMLLEHPEAVQGCDPSTHRAR